VKQFTSEKWLLFYNPSVSICATAAPTVKRTRREGHVDRCSSLSRHGYFVPIDLVIVGSGIEPRSDVFFVNVDNKSWQNTHNGITSTGNTITHYTHHDWHIRIWNAIIIWLICKIKMNSFINVNILQNRKSQATTTKVLNSIMHITHSYIYHFQLSKLNIVITSI